MREKKGFDQDAFLGLSAPRAIAKFAIPTILSQLVTLLCIIWRIPFSWDIPMILRRWLR